MSLQSFKTFTDAQRRQFGPVRKAEVLRTERHVYTTPFLYDNVEAGEFMEIDPTKGIELKANDGYITIAEDKPIVAVTVVGSGCTPKGYNICEWWDEGESIETMKNQLVKRQRVDNLNGTHPSVWSMILMGTAPATAFRDVSNDMKNAFDCLKKLSDGFYEGYYLGFYENVANFRIGPPNPKQVTIRAGSKVVEDPGTCWERSPGDYAVRMIETHVVI